MGIFLLSVIFIVSPVAAQSDCSSYNDQATCDTNNCLWQSNEWGSWCEELNCWSLWNQSACQSTAISGKNCTWTTGSSTGWCEEASCWSFTGANETTCINNTMNLQCRWVNSCSGYNPNVDCWSLVDESACVNTTGCMWGMCDSVGCQEHNTNNTCLAAKGYNKKTCTWDAGSSSCSETYCSNYLNESACDTGGCSWSNGYCQELWCSNFDYTNSTNCESNAANLSCTWSSPYCNSQGCWDSNTQGACSLQPGCTWKTSTATGWCEEINCWSWDSWNGGNQSICLANATIYGLNCIWEDMPGGTSGADGWCYKNLTGTSCSNLTTEYDCMESYYCFWDYYASECKDPGNFAFNNTVFTEWNPGCYVFDLNSTSCGNVTGCNWTGSSCAVIDANIQQNGLNCTSINNSVLCNAIPVLSTCCSWEAGQCTANQYSTACWDQMEEPPAGANFCEDYNAYSSETICNQIANHPWYMPCAWDNSSKTCGFKSDDVFGNDTNSLIFIDNKKSCEAAGGKWFTENYCEGNISVPTGRCEYKFDDETSCDKACFACEKYTGKDATDGAGKPINITNAEDACISSKLGYCEFTADTSAPNGIGYCTAKKEYRGGVAGDCDTDCGSCTYKGNSGATLKTPEYYCTKSKANSDGGGCKWVTDNTTSQGGYCIKKGDKTCEDACDRCYSQDDCSTIGRKKIANTTGSCKWQGSGDDGACVPNVGEDVEICWDGIDNTDDDLIDCADPGCYADPFCGFVSGDCFGWMNNDSCITNGCEWVNDSWNPSGWCDYPGSQCWKYDVNQSLCDAQSNCQWSADMGSGWCEQDWSVAETCMGLNMTDCQSGGVYENCTWTDDAWCNGEGTGTDWCQNNGGWCDHINFQPKDCWKYQSSSAQCNNQTDCSWRTDPYAQPHCEVNYSGGCNDYTNSSACGASGCWWNDAYGGWCEDLMEQCWKTNTQLDCESKTSGGTPICYWDTWMNSCQPLCFNGTNSMDLNACNAVPGCYWAEDTGWCEEQSMEACSNTTNWNNATACNNADGCRWRDPGWCDPIGGGFSSGGGGGECYKYDGNQSACTNQTLINITCGWFPEPMPWCDIDWSSDCWQYPTEASGCNATNGCWWNSDMSYCTNLMDQCWNNMSLQEWGGNPSWDTDCNANQYCNTTSWNSCEPLCMSATDQGSCTSGCRWITGWCNPAGMHEMFNNMEKGAPVPLGIDLCGDILENISQPSVDICGFGMKDMGDAYGFGVNVFDFSNASICNKEKISSFVMSMVGGAMGGGPGGPEKVGNGNETVILFVYLDMDGSSIGGCTLTHNSSAEGYEFRFKYSSIWNVSTNKAKETFNAYKCENSKWKATDIEISAWKKKMCSEIGGPMIAVEKGDLARFPTLYDPNADMRVAVATIGDTGNISSPTDTADPGWTTPGSIDFEIQDFFSYGVDTAKYEDILKKGFVQYEDCYNGVDDDSDTRVDCDDFECEFASVCEGVGVNAPGYEDTTSPQLSGARIEKYTDAALIMYDTNKPTNGIVQFYYNDSNCLTLNTSIYDVGIRKNNTVREYKVWHTGEIYNDGGAASLNYALVNDTTYYYKIKVCDSGGKCAISQCSSFKTSSPDRCGYCNFVTRINTPSNWMISYDVDRDGVYEHMQGYVCGPNAAMKSNYTSGRRVHVFMNNSDNTSAFWFFNVTLTRTGLNNKVRTISNASSLTNGTTTTAGGTTIGYTGMISDTRDKIINTLHPELCRIKIPGTGTCTELWHCGDDLSDCSNRTSDANLVATGSDYCIWDLPYCEFSTWAGGEPGTLPDSSNPTAAATGGGGGGGGGGGAVVTKKIMTFSEIVPGTPAVLRHTNKLVSLKRLELYVLKNATDVKVTVDKLSSRPSIVSDVAGTVYQYLNITVENINVTDISRGVIIFNVTKEWMNNNSFRTDEIVLRRFTDTWEDLATVLKSQGATDIEYEATTYGFSVFAVTAEKKTTLPADLCTSDCSPSSTTCPDGFVASCQNTCNPNTGICSTCTPDCTNHDASSSVCGNGLCENDETSDNCPADCASKEVKITERGQVITWIIMFIIIIVVGVAGWFYYHGHHQVKRVFEYRKRFK